MDVLTVEDWTEGAREVAALERGGRQHLREARYDPGLTLVDGGTDPRAWLAPASGTRAAHAASPDHLRHSPCSSTGSYQGERRC